MNLTSSQVASATPAFPTVEPMADVIDSLKRLERLGDEKSKTVQKILEAAEEIESRILQLYVECQEGTTIRCSAGFSQPRPQIPSWDVPGERAPGQYDSECRAFERDAQQRGLSVELYDRTYRIENLHGRRRLIRNSDISSNDEGVSENRDAALRFADDIAKGLLVTIAEDLARQQQENEKALAALESAKGRLAKTK